MRRKWVDVYRGIAVLFMVMLHFFVNIFPVQPLPLLNYSIRGVIAIGDMAIALFLFISGVSAYLSISDRKKAKNENEAIKHVLIRYLKIFILGLLLDIILIASVEGIWWVLEAISLSGLIALLFICFSVRMKVLAIALLGISYSYLASIPPIYDILSAFPNGGLFGSIPLSGIVLVGYMAGEHMMKRKKEALPFLLKAGMLLMLAGFVLSYFMIYDRGVGTFPYIVLSSGFCILFMVLLYWLVELKGISSKLLEGFGKSALLIFVLNYPILITALALHVNNSFSVEQTALITVVLVSLLVIASKLYVKFSGF
jgi:predicted acyltransferase